MLWDRFGQLMHCVPGNNVDNAERGCVVQMLGGWVGSSYCLLRSNSVVGVNGVTAWLVRPEP